MIVGLSVKVGRSIGAQDTDIKRQTTTFLMEALKPSIVFRYADIFIASISLTSSIQRE